jgi:hypothetical protein
MRSESKHLKSSYLDQLVREMQHLICSGSYSPSPDVEEIMKTMAAVRAASRKWPLAEFFKNTPRYLISSSDIYLLETTLIDHLDPTRLRIRIAALRDMLSSLITAKSYKAIEPILTKLENTKLKPEPLRSEARELLSRIYRRYETVPAVEYIRYGLVIRIISASAVILTAMWILKWTHILDASESIFYVGAAGAVGAAISTIQRLYSLNPRIEPYVTCLSLQSGQWSTAISPLIGLIFAGVMWLVIRSGLISGPLFPDSLCWAATNCLHGSSRDFSKLIFWGFAAGWTERLVPDVLNRLSSAAPEAIRSQAREQDS